MTAPTSLPDALAAAGILLRRTSPGTYRAPCPQCDRGSKDTALGVTIDDDGGFVSHCFRCSWCSAWRPHDRSPKRGERSRDARPKVSRETKKRWSSLAESICQNAAPPIGSLAETYLQARKCVVPADADLRFVANYLGHPAMVARVTDFATGETMTLHFTLLKSDGSDKANVEHPKRLLTDHAKQGGVIRLCDDCEVTIGLGLAEGVETALTIAACGWWPIWAAVDAGNLADLPVISGIEAITIFADHDANGVGERSANCLAKRWRDAGREARIAMPPNVGEDWADVVARLR